MSETLGSEMKVTSQLARGYPVSCFLQAQHEAASSPKQSTAFPEEPMFTGTICCCVVHVKKKKRTVSNNVPTSVLDIFFGVHVGKSIKSNDGRRHPAMGS